MGIGVLVIGASGSGKTTAVKGFAPDEVGIFAVEKSRLPFKEGKNYKVAKNATYRMLATTFKGNTALKRYVIDDSQYLMVNEMFDRSSENGYTKFTEMAKHFRDLIHIVNHQLPDDVVVYFLHHSEADGDGRIKAKTIGKMLDEKLTVEGCFDVVLYATIENGEHVFITQSDGTTTAKSPDGMLPLKMPNNLKLVDDAIRDYYGMNEKTEEDSTDD